MDAMEAYISFTSPTGRLETRESAFSAGELERFTSPTGRLETIRAQPEDRRLHLVYIPDG